MVKFVNHAGPKDGLSAMENEVDWNSKQHCVNSAFPPCSEPQHCALLRSRIRRVATRLESRTEEVASSVDRAQNVPILGHPRAEHGHLNPASVARALLVLVRAACLRGARRILRRLALKLRFSQGIRGLFASSPVRSKTLVFPGFFADRANCFGLPTYPCMCI